MWVMTVCPSKNKVFMGLAPGEPRMVLGIFKVYRASPDRPAEALASSVVVGVVP